MQTFVPLTSSFEDIARTLDRARLNKQALEGWQILTTLLELDPQGDHRQPKGWGNTMADVLATVPDGRVIRLSAGVWLQPATVGGLRGRRSVADRRCPDWPGVRQR